MKTFEYTAKTLSFLHNCARDAGPQLGNNDWMVLAALTPPILAAFALTEIGTWCIDEIARQIRIREKRPASPSLRGTPTPNDIVAPWSASPRTLRDRLRIGSRLADLDPTLDHTISRTTLPSGKTVFRARPGGMKGWLTDRRVAVPYSTVMRYKKLAQRLRQLFSLDDRLPLEWVMDGIPGGKGLPADLAAPFAAARRRLAAILRKNHSLAALSRFEDAKLGIVRLVTVRKTRPVRHRAALGKHGKTTGFTVISHGHRANVSPGRLDATKQVMARLLGAQKLAGPALHLQNRIKAWLAGLSPAAAP